MKTIALLPVRNEAWILENCLECLSGFCDVILVSDQNSEDASRDICRNFAKVVVLESATADVCEVGRWALLDAAREYDGNNLLWCTDADELIAPGAFHAFLAAHAHELTPGTVVECLFHHLWSRPDRYRDDASPYAPYWKEFALVDDRTTDYDRSPTLPLHQPRVPLGDNPTILRSQEIHVLHLQWLLGELNQIKQAWYRCRELLDGRTSTEINARYSITLPAPRARTSPVAPEWTAGVRFPQLGGGEESSWQEREIFQWLDTYGPERFEPLEMWHIPRFLKYFRDQTGRRPKPDRSYLPPLSHRARRFAGRVAKGTRRRLLP